MPALPPQPVCFENWLNDAVSEVVQIQRPANRRTLIIELSRWIEQNCSRERLALSYLLKRYRRVRRIKRELPEDFDRLSPEQLAKLINIAKERFQMAL